MALTLLLDNVDYSMHLTKRGYTVSYKKVLGPNSVTTLDGMYHEDVLARKAVVTIPLRPLKSSELSALIDACDDCQNATYLDTKTNTVVTKAATATLSAASLVLSKVNAVFWANSLDTGVTLTLEER